MNVLARVDYVRALDAMRPLGPVDEDVITHANPPHVCASVSCRFQGSVEGIMSALTPWFQLAIIPHSSLVFHCDGASDGVSVYFHVRGELA
jgi:hypothetical protein